MFILDYLVSLCMLPAAKLHRKENYRYHSFSMLENL